MAFAFEGSTVTAPPSSTAALSAMQQAQIATTGCYDLNPYQQCLPGWTPNATFSKCCKASAGVVSVVKALSGNTLILGAAGLALLLLFRR